MKAGTFIALALTLAIGSGTASIAMSELNEGILLSSKTSKKAAGKAKKKNTKKKGKAASSSTKKNKAQSAADDNGAEVSRNEGILKGEDWRNCAKVKSDVAAAILKAAGDKSDEEIIKLFGKSENRLLLAQWVVADAELRSGEEVRKSDTERQNQLKKAKENLAAKTAQIPAEGEPSAAFTWDLNNLKKQVARLESECASEHTFTESAGDKDGTELMGVIGGNNEWMQSFAFSGECVRPGMALSILKKLLKKYPEILKDPMVRDIATATALEYAKSGWNQQDAVDRASFYINAWKDDRLNIVFDTIPMWQRRMVCGCKGDNQYGSVASLTWALDNFHLAADQYSGSCWRCAYRLNNIYGDSIHGPMYYAPFESDMGDNRQAMTHYVGGVCGSLSHFGAFAALANGVPAMTAGEPGHCAFIVLVNDKWTPAYSLSWQRGLHWQIFRNVHTFSSLHSASELYSDAQEKETRTSDTWRILGGVYAEKGDFEKAMECYEKAATAQPRNFMAWREWREALEKNTSAGAKPWIQLNDTMCKHLVPLYPEMAAEHMNKGLTAALAKNLKPEQLRKAFTKFWKNVKDMGPDRWRIETLCSNQLAALNVQNNTDKICEFYSDVLAATASNSKYAPAILSWGDQLSSKLDKPGKAKVMQAIIKGIGNSSGMSTDERVQLLTPAILAAEKNRDVAAFQSLSKMVKATGFKNKDVQMPKFEAFPGKLASEGGLVWMSSTSQWDKPHDHAGLLTPEGGSFHTGKDKDAYVAVELPRQVNVTGVVVVCTNGNLHRCNNMKVQVSENGTDWKDVHDFGPCNQRVMRANLGGKLPLAKYVRILRQGGPEFFHINGIYVYGKQAA